MAKKTTPYPLKLRFRELVELKEKRDERTYSYRDISEETGMALGTVVAWMNDNVLSYNKKTLSGILIWLEATPNQLFGFEDIEEGNKSAYRMLA